MLTTSFLLTKQKLEKQKTLLALLGLGAIAFGYYLYKRSPYLRSLGYDKDDTKMNVSGNSISLFR